jgi:hypothetical protein
VTYFLLLFFKKGEIQRRADIESNYKATTISGGESDVLSMR